MSLKYNINLIHSNIKEFYKETNIKESSDKKFGNYFKLNIISEGKELIIIVNKKDLEGNIFNWKYYSDPLNEDSHLVERTSDFESPYCYFQLLWKACYSNVVYATSGVPCISKTIYNIVRIYARGNSI